MKGGGAAGDEVVRKVFVIALAKVVVVKAWEHQGTDVLAKIKRICKQLQLYFFLVN